jgi:predicted transcriptional regulator
MPATTAKTRTPRDTENKVEQAKKLIAEGLSQQDVAKQIDVSGWTISQWKKKGKLGELPKGRIPKGESSRVVTPIPAKSTTKPVKSPRVSKIEAASPSVAALEAEIVALKETIVTLKALVPAEKLAAYKQARAAALAALD